VSCTKVSFLYSGQNDTNTSGIRSDMAPESESSDEDRVSNDLGDDKCDGLRLDKSSNDGFALDAAREVDEGSNLGSNGE